MKYKSTKVYGTRYDNPNQALFDLLYGDGGVDEIIDAIRVIKCVILKFKIKKRNIINNLYTTYLEPYINKQ